MAVVVGNLLQVNVQWRYLDLPDTIINQYWYEVLDATAVSPNVGLQYQSWAAQFYESVILPQMNLLSTAMTCSAIVVENKANNIDFAVITNLLLSQGTVPGDTLPKFVTFKFRLNRGSKLTRNGYKRLCGVSENLQLNGNYNGVTSKHEDVSEAMLLDISSEGLEPGNYILARPVIVRRSAEGVPLVWQDVESVSFQGIGTQNSRK